MKFNDTLTTVIKQALQAGTTPALMGEPAIGKSSFVEDLARSMNTKAFVLPVNQLAAKEDLTGARLEPYTRDDGTQSRMQMFYPHHVIQEAIDYAEANPREWPILFLDEINRTTSDVTSGALTLVTLRRMGHIDLPKNLRLMIAGNDKGNITTLDEASLSRFAIFHVEPDAATFTSIHGDDLNGWVKKVLTEHPNLIFQKSTPAAIVADGADEDEDGNVTMADLFDGGEEMNQLTAPRTIANLSNWLNVVEHDELATHLAAQSTIDGRETSQLNEIVEAFVGDTMFATQVVATIAADIATGVSNTQQNRVNVPRPNCYGGLKAVGSITEMDDKIADLTESERSGSLLFALKEGEDNARLVEHLAQNITQIEPDHTRTLMEMVSSGQFDKQNLDAFLASQGPIVGQLRPILDAYV